MRSQQHGQMLLPFARSYWVVPGRFLAGCYPGSTDPEEARQKVSGLLSCGIQSVISLMEEDELDWNGKPFSPYAPLYFELAAQAGLTVRCKRIPIRDQGIPSRVAMVSILDAIDDAIGKLQPVFVHCWGGKGRTGTVVGCWLARHGVSQGPELLKVIQHLRRNDPTAHEASPETFAQRDFVIIWKVGD